MKQIQFAKTYNTYQFLIADDTAKQFVRVPNYHIGRYVRFELQAVQNASDIVQFAVKNDSPNTFYVIQFAQIDQDHNLVIKVDAEHTDSWAPNTLYSGSEGEIGVSDIKGTDKWKEVRRKYVTQSKETFANIIVSMLLDKLKEARGSKVTPRIKHTHIKEVEEGSIVWREATSDEQKDPTIKWEMEGTSKYGRRMVNRERHIWRSLSMSEFYGGGVVD